VDGIVPKGLADPIERVIRVETTITSIGRGAKSCGIDRE
jgi:hypothetical protein